MPRKYIKKAAKLFKKKATTQAPKTATNYRKKGVKRSVILAGTGAAGYAAGTGVTAHKEKKRRKKQVIKAVKVGYLAGYKRGATSGYTITKKKTKKRRTK